MKTDRFIIFFMLVLCASIGDANAQNSFRHSATYNGHKAIVRQVDDNIAIAYSQENDDQGYFFYDNFGVELRYATMWPDCRVYDFEIHDDTVFFCGKYNHTVLGTCGIFGFFDINDVFFNGGNINGIYCDYSITANPPEYNLRPTTLWRMDVFNKGYTHIVAVGACLQEGPLPTPVTNTAVYDVYFDGINWHCEAYSQKPGQQYYTDIVTTEHYITAVAKSEYSEKCYIRQFDKIIGFLSSTISNHVIDVVDNNPVGKVIVDAIDNDTVAVSNFYYNNNEAGVSVKKFAITSIYPNTSIINSTHIPMNTHPSVSTLWNLRDIRYNNTQKKLALLLDMDYPVHNSPQSTILEIATNTSMIPFTIIASWSGTTCFYALDQWLDGYHAIGSKPGSPSDIMAFFRKEFGINSMCGNIFNPVPYYDNTQNVVLQIDAPTGIIVEPELMIFHYTPKTNEVSITTDCN